MALQLLRPQDQAQVCRIYVGIGHHRIAPGQDSKGGR
jgi:hypothetical protein